MTLCPHCHGSKGWSEPTHDQSCVLEDECERHSPIWRTCWTCRGDGTVSDLQLAIYQARGGPAPIPLTQL